MRRLFHGFFALAVLLGGIGAEPPATGPAPAPHVDCCCGDEAACPCAPVRAPQGPRCPSGQAAPVAFAALAAAPRRADLAEARREPRPWLGLTAGWVAPDEATPSDLPRTLARPPDRGPERQSLLRTFRI